MSLLLLTSPERRLPSMARKEEKKGGVWWWAGPRSASRSSTSPPAIPHPASSSRSAPRPLLPIPPPPSPAPRSARHPLSWLSTVALHVPPGQPAAGESKVAGETRGSWSPLSGTARRQWRREEPAMSPLKYDCGGDILQRCVLAARRDVDPANSLVPVCDEPPCCSEMSLVLLYEGNRD